MLRETHSRVFHTPMSPLKTKRVGNAVGRQSGWSATSGPPSGRVLPLCLLAAVGWFVRVGTLNARNGREVFVNRRKLAVGHVEEERPAHDLQFAAVKGKGRATTVRCSSTVGVPLVHVHTGAQDRDELIERMTFWLA